MLKSFARTGLNAADRLCLVAGRGARGPAGVLVGVLFHSLYADRAQLGDPSLAPNQDVTVDAFRCFVQQMLEDGYSAVTPAQVDAGLDAAGRYFIITFDDGYFNNTLALDVLREFRVPATFFISAGHVRDNKSFWWDALSRRLAAAGVAGAGQRREIERLKAWPPHTTEALLLRRFGDRVLQPCGDLDRPFTVRELRQFAASPWVHLGNHTHDHAILTRCEPGEMARQISGCQQALAEWTGREPIAIAYPNGNHSPAAALAAMNAGLRLAFTVTPARTRLPLSAAQQRMAIGRFLFDGARDTRQQCASFGARAVPSHWLHRLLHSAY
jgi:peptidoglycan/xylan/chitin deacetylase (PgdA/CDA1 family)